MLLNAFAFIACTAIVAAAAIAGGTAAARTALLVRAQTAAAAGIAQAASAAVNTLAQQIQTNGTIPPSPALTPPPPACADAQCALSLTSTVALAAGSEQTAPQLETNSYVGEQRVELNVSVAVSAGGLVLVRRSAGIVVRETLTPPYAALAGVSDQDAGVAPVVDACASASPGIAEDTSVRVQYRNAVSSDCTDGSTWSSGSYAGDDAPQGWSP